MRYNVLKSICVLMLGLGLNELHAQTASIATSGNVSGSGGSASYSVGQLFYTTITGPNGSVAQGMQQPYEISVVSGIEEAPGISLLVSAYPNPAPEYLTLKVDVYTSLNIQSLSFQLLDMNGKLLESKLIDSNLTTISMYNLVPAVYFVNVIHMNKSIKEFKIIKK
jgi:hypothetical protein